jgi:hypothetical protein
MNDRSTSGGAHVTPEQARDLALSEAQEAVHVERFNKGSLDSFYAGMRHAEAVIRRMREGQPNALAVEHSNLRAALLTLHRPWYEVNGVRYEHTVLVYEDDLPKGHVCRDLGTDRCYDGEHYAVACCECRVFGAEADVTCYALWPCSTAALVLPAANGEEER